MTASPYLISNEMYNATYGTSSNILEETQNWLDNEMLAGNPSISEGSMSIWEELAAPVQNTGAFVWSTATGAWESVKEGAFAISEAGSKVIDSAGNVIGGVFDWVQGKVLIFLGLGLLAVYVIAKSGILGQATGLLLAAK